MRWRKSDCSLCRICHKVETLEHLLFTCTYANGVWRDFMKNTGENITFKDIVIGTKSKVLNMVTTLIAYFIFKQWTQESLHNVLRQPIGKLDEARHYISHKETVYREIGWVDVANFCSTNLLNYLVN